ncbi:MAG TPA: hypothetical protein VF173_06120 [Thermoanaerobaculia bacterium]|nr:hypothetical protein [Thermoanaerobaculia bacterium]
MSSPNLALAGVISKLSIRQWSGRKSDKSASRDTAARHQAAESMVRVSKDLVPKDALEPIRRFANEVRAFHYDHTICWSEGAQFLPARLTIPYSGAMQEFKLGFDSLVAGFCAQYAKLIEEAPTLLGQLFQQDDYPAPGRMRQHFSLDVDFEPVPEAGHFFAGLASNALDAFREDLEAKNEQRENAMRQDLWQRLHEPVLKMAEALRDPDRIFRDTLVTNIAGIAERIDDLNIFDDPSLASLASSVRTTLATLEPGLLRASPSDRAAAASAARELADSIARKMSPFMSLVDVPLAA